MINFQAVPRWYCDGREPLRPRLVSRPMRFRKRRSRTRLRLSLAILVLALAGGFVVWRPSLPLVPATSSFDPILVQRGAALAAIGNCNICHTAEGGAPYAGGRPIATPFGTVYSTNITPDRETGIGGWSEAAFTRAMRDGVSRNGTHLYPAFPYDHMTRMQPADIDAVYAFVMTRQPVSSTPPENDLSFPFNLRPLVAGWKLLFLDKDAQMPDDAQSAEWKRGAYLVEGLGHCGACHTPRNVLGAENRRYNYGGGESDGWIAPALNADSPAAVPWDAGRLYAYLRHGFDDRHGLAAGPMAPVVRNLANVPDGDVRAISAYVASLAGTTPPGRIQIGSQAVARAQGQSPPPVPRGPANTAGATLYAGACAQCHGEASRAPEIRALHLALSSTLRTPRPDNLIRIVREGVHQPGGAGEPVMPGFANVLRDEQIVSLVAYLRQAFTDSPAWTDIDQSLRRVRESDAEKLRAQQKASLP
jgi:mono/diheme cytochrome c family protein